MVDRNSLVKSIGFELQLLKPFMSARECEAFAEAALRAIENEGLAIVPNGLTAGMRAAVREIAVDQFVAYANAVWPTLLEEGKVK